MKASELKRGMIIKEGDDFLMVVEMDHKTPGNLRAIYQATFRSILGEKIVNRRFSPSDTVEKADLEAKQGQYLYKDHSGYHFMDMDNYETLILGENLIGPNKDYLKENLEVKVLYYGNRPVTVELPVSLALKVIESSPGTKGDTTGRAMKLAKLETGLEISVPLFIDEGETILVDTRTGEYLGRA